MGADPEASVIHGIAYTGDDGSEHFGFAIGHEPAGLVVRDLLTASEASAADSPVGQAVMALLDKRGGERQSWLLFEDAELVVGVGRKTIGLDKILRPILAVSPSYLPFLVGEYPSDRIFVFELGMREEDDGTIRLEPFSPPSWERRLDAVAELIFNRGSNPRARARASATSGASPVVFELNPSPISSARLGMDLLLLPPTARLLRAKRARAECCQRQKPFHFFDIECHGFKPSARSSTTAAWLGERWAVPHRPAVSPSPDSETDPLKNEHTVLEYIDGGAFRLERPAEDGLPARGGARHPAARGARRAGVRLAATFQGGGLGPNALFRNR
jgi:hypothetical protein